jgi:hypothetical protein
LKGEKFIPKVSTVIAQQLRRSVKGEDELEFYLAPLTGLKNAWQFGATFFDNNLYTTVIKTVE